MLFTPFANRGLAWPAGVVGVFWLATVHRLGLRGFTHSIVRQHHKDLNAAGKDVSIDNEIGRADLRRLSVTHRQEPRSSRFNPPSLLVRISCLAAFRHSSGSVSTHSAHHIHESLAFEPRGTSIYVRGPR